MGILKTELYKCDVCGYKGTSVYNFRILEGIAKIGDVRLLGNTNTATVYCIECLCNKLGIGYDQEDVFNSDSAYESLHFSYEKKEKDDVGSKE